MRTDTSKKIIAYISKKKAATAKELIDYLEISPQAVFKQLKALIGNGQIIKSGLPPKVFYSIKETHPLARREILDKSLKKIIDGNYLLITPGGDILRGVDGFENWCQKNGLSLVKTAAGTIFIEDFAACQNILLIDDAVGSGATFNETARKIKEKNLCFGKIIGLAITGSFKGFDVLTEI